MFKVLEFTIEIQCGILILGYGHQPASPLEPAHGEEHVGAFLPIVFKFSSFQIMILRVSCLNLSKTMTSPHTNLYK
jgi:hypothetical protein